MSEEIRIALKPQPKYGMPFQIVGDTTGRFYNVNPSYPRSAAMTEFERVSGQRLLDSYLREAN